MAYLTLQELVSNFDQEEIDELTQGLDEAAKTEKIDTALAYAEATINSYLSRRYRLPVPDVTLVKPMAADIARYRLYDNLASGEVEKRFDKAIAHLKDIANHKADLAGGNDDEALNVDSADQSIHLSSIATADLNLESY